MSIRRWLRRWFGAPERFSYDDLPEAFSWFLTTGPGVRCTSTSDGGTWQCSRDEGHPGDHASRAEFGPGCVGWRQVPFRDTGSGDRDAGVDALVERS